MLIGVDSRVTAIDLPVVGYEQALSSFIEPPHLNTGFLLGSAVSHKGETELNALVTRLLGEDAFGECVVIPRGIKVVLARFVRPSLTHTHTLSLSLSFPQGKYLYNLLRREFFQTWRVPLSSDAFSGFGRDRFMEHNDECIEASMFLKSTLVPRVVEYLDHIASDADSYSLDGLTVTRLMQERGVNMRLLGLVWARSQHPSVKVGRAAFCFVGVLCVHVCFCVCVACMMLIETQLNVPSTTLSPQQTGRLHGRNDDSCRQAALSRRNAHG